VSEARGVGSSGEEAGQGGGLPAEDEDPVAAVRRADVAGA
jgi:hypothetical protein